VYFCVVSGNATIAFWAPSIIKEIGVKGNLQIGLISAIPFVAGTLAMIWNGFHSDKTGERRMHSAIATLIACIGLIATGMSLGNATLALCSLTLAAIGILAAFPVFWSIPGAFLAGTAAAGGTPYQRLHFMVSKLNRAMQRNPLLTEAMTRAYVFADASAAGEVDHVEKIIDSMFARAMSDGEPTEDQYHIARVISDVWLSNLLAWLTRRASASDVSKRLELAVRLLIGDGETV
jgi:hypothetical protein